MLSHPTKSENEDIFCKTEVNLKHIIPKFSFTENFKNQMIRLKKTSDSRLIKKYETCFQERWNIKFQLNFVNLQHKCVTSTCNNLESVNDLDDEILLMDVNDQDDKGNMEWSKAGLLKIFNIHINLKHLARVGEIFTHPNKVIANWRSSGFLIFKVKIESFSLRVLDVTT